MEQPDTLKRLAGVAIAFIEISALLVVTSVLIQAVYGQAAAAQFMQIYQWAWVIEIYVGWTWYKFFLAPFRAAWRLIRRD